MEFRKYQHIERFGTPEVDGINIGTCHIFPKIDGTNASVWINDGVICYGSRNRELSLDNDNADFMAEMSKDQNIATFLMDNPNMRLYGEWLVPHSLKTYRDDAWRKFYVFDVSIDKTEDEIKHEGDSKLKYLSYDEYQPLLEQHGIDYIVPMAIIKNPDYDKLVGYLKANTFLVSDGMGAGEGIVIKNYDFYNKYGRQTWAKMVTSEFKEKHYKEMGAPISEGKKMVEQEIVDEYCTKSLIEKEFAKIDNEVGWTSKMIPRLLNTVFYCLVKEECWNFIKQHRNPKIDFKTLNQMVILKIKEVKPELF